jgi:hypothetical protein
MVYRYNLLTRLSGRAFPGAPQQAIAGVPLSHTGTSRAATRAYSRFVPG